MISSDYHVVHCMRESEVGIGLEHSSSNNLVVDVDQWIEHLTALHHGEVWPQTKIDLSREYLQIRTQELDWRVHHHGLIIL